MKDYISTKIKDYIKPYIRVWTEIENKYLKLLFTWMIKWKKSILTEIWRKSSDNTRQFVKNVSRFLKKWKTIKYELPYFRRLEKKITTEYLIIHDETDINKDNAKVMEWLTDVRDWSTWEIVKWYKLNWSIAVSKTWEYKILPIFLSVINYLWKNFKSEWESLLEEIKNMLNYGVGLLNIHIFDRWYDSRWFFEELFNLRIRFIVRAKMIRNLVFRWEKHNIKVVVETLLLEMSKKKKKQIEWFEIEENEIIYEEVYDKEMYEEKYKMTIVIIKRIWYKSPMVLFTNCKIWDEFYKSIEIYEFYLKRWNIEQYFKFIKQKFWLEKIQLLDIKVIQRFLFLICLLSDFVLLEFQKKNSKEVLGYFEDVASYFDRENIVVDSPYWMVDYLANKLNEIDKSNLYLYNKTINKVVDNQLFLPCLSIFESNLQI